MKKYLRIWFPKGYEMIKKLYHACLRDPLMTVATKLFTRHCVCDVRDIVVNEHKNGEFNCFDMIVRLLAIENYYGLNNNGFVLYEKQQNARKAEEWETAVPRFKALIQSYEKNGYDKSSEIVIGRDHRLWDGSHRMAFAFYRKDYLLSCKIVPFTRNNYYGINWHGANGFTDEEIRQIQNRYEQLLKEHFNAEQIEKINKMMKHNGE